MKKIITKILLVSMLATTLIGCSKEEKINKELDQAVINDEKVEFDDYSKGLDESGFYLDFDKVLGLPDFSKLVLTYDEVIQHKTKTSNELEGTTYETADDWLYNYTNEYLVSLGLAKKDVIEEGDRVIATVNFFIDGEALEDYSTQKPYEMTVPNEDPIATSMIGHKLNEEYEIDYKMTVYDGEHTGKDAVVKIKIDDIDMGDPIAEGVVENKNDEINKIIPDIKTADDLIEFMKPVAATTYLPEYLQYYIRDVVEVDVPEEYMEYELYRFKYRLNQMNTTYSKYLKDANSTDELTKQYCMEIAKENYIAMTIFDEITADGGSEYDVCKYFGESYEAIAESQGSGYTALRMIREVALAELSGRVVLVEKLEDVSISDEHVEEKEDLSEITEVDTDNIEQLAPIESEETVAEQVEEILSDEKDKTEE